MCISHNVFTYVSCLTISSGSPFNFILVLLCAKINFPYLKKIFKHECIQVGCILSTSVAFCWGEGCLHMGGVCPGGVCPGGCLPRRLSARGLCLPRGGGVCTPPPWTEFLAHACENITFPQLRLGAVIKTDLYEIWTLHLLIISQVS